MRIKKIALFFCLLFSGDCFTQTWGVVGGGVNKTGGGWIDDMDVLQNKLYVCGGFVTAGNINANYIASWSNGKWDSLGSGTSTGAPSRLTHSNTMLYAGGAFLGAGGVSNTHRLAKWDGSQWLSVSSNVPNSDQIYALKFKNDFYVGGNFNQVGSLNVNRIAKWNATSWSDVAGGVTGGFMPEVICMATFNGELFSGGDFTFAGGKAANYIARWNGISWDSVGAGLNDLPSRMLADTLNNILYVTGSFTSAGGTSINHGLAKWDGLNWSGVGNPLPTQIYPGVMTIYRGKLFVGYGSSTSSIADTLLACWDGTTWKRIEGPNNNVTALAVYNDTLYVGGYFDKIYDSTKGWLNANYIAKYWEPLSGMNELSQSLKFNVFPNPAKKEINLQVISDKSTGTSEKYIVQIKNSIGQEIFQQQFSKQLKIDTSQFPKGVCLVEVCTSEGKLCHTEKVVVQ